MNVKLIRPTVSLFLLATLAGSPGIAGDPDRRLREVMARRGQPR